MGVRNRRGRANVERFERELATEIGRIFNEDVKVAVDEIALEIRENAAKNTVAVGAVDDGDFLQGWMAGPGVDKTVRRGSEQAARAALANRKTGEGAWVYNNDWKGWWIEHGFHDRAGIFHGPRPVLRSAVEQVKNRVIRLGELDRLESFWSRLPQ